MNTGINASALDKDYTHTYICMALRRVKVWVYSHGLLPSAFHKLEITFGPLAGRELASDALPDVAAEESTSALNPRKVSRSSIGGTPSESFEWTSHST